MKKFQRCIASVLVGACLASNALAADLSEIEGHYNGADFSRFADPSYSVTHYNEFSYLTEINQKGITFKLKGPKKNYYSYKVTIEFVLRLYYDNNKPHAIPLLSITLDTDDNHNRDTSLYIRRGGNRYLLQTNNSNLMAMGRPALDILDEISSCEDEVKMQLKFVSGWYEDGYAPYILTAKDKADIHKFVEDIKLSGLYDLLAETDDSSVITLFN